MDDVRTQLLAELAELQHQHSLIPAHKPEALQLMAARIDEVEERLSLLDVEQCDEHPAIFAPLRAHRQNYAPSRPMAFGKALVLCLVTVAVAAALLLKVCGVLTQ